MTSEVVGGLSYFVIVVFFHSHCGKYLIFLKFLIVFVNIVLDEVPQSYSISFLLLEFLCHACLYILVEVPRHACYYFVMIIFSIALRNPVKALQPCFIYVI